MRPHAHQEVVDDSLVAQQANPRIHAQQERDPERQNHREQQHLAAARRLPCDEVRHRIAEQQAQERTDRCHLQRREIDGCVVIVFEQEQVVVERGPDPFEPLPTPFQQRGKRRLCHDRISEADLEDDHERGEKEHQQPQVRQHDRPAQPALALRARVGGFVAHERNRIVLETSHDRYTSSSHSTVSFAERRRFCALTCSTAPLCSHTRYSD